MTEPTRPEPGIEGHREQAVQRLMESFANDVLDVEEFERRLDVVNKAETAVEINKLLLDLPSPASVPAVRPESGMVADPDAVGNPAMMVPADRVRERQLILAILGGMERKGRWVPARRSNVIAMMGGGTLDFREAMLGPGVTEVWTFCMWGGLEVIVPPEMAVEVDGLAIMGGFEWSSNEPRERSPDAPLLRIRGMALMGGVEVTVRRAGESARDARKRRKLEKKMRRKMLQSGDMEP